VLVSYTASLTNLIAEVRYRADMTGSEFVSDTEITGYLNRELAKLHQFIVANQGQPYIYSSRTFTTSNGTATYAIDTGDFFQLMAVDINIGTGIVLSARPFMGPERNAYNSVALTGWDPYLPIYYRLEGANIRFIPTPGGAHSVTIWYLPKPSTLAASTVGGGVQSIDLYCGWDEYLVLGAAYKCLVKEENSSAAALKAEQNEVLEIIKTMISRRDAGAPERAVDVIGYGDDYL
jgi:hypothetical protein